LVGRVSGKEVDSNFLAAPIESISVVGSEEKSSLKLNTRRRK